MAAAGDRFVLRSDRAAGHDRRRTGAGPAAAQARPGGGARHPSGALRSGDPLEVLRLEIEAARSGLEAADRAEELGRLAGTGEAVRRRARAGRWFTPGCSTRHARPLMAAAGDDPRPRARRRSHTAPGSTPAGRPRCWRRWPPRVSWSAAMAATCVPGRRRSARPARAGAARRLRGRRRAARRDRGARRACGRGAGGGARGAGPPGGRGEVVRVKPGIYYHPAALEQRKGGGGVALRARRGRHDRRACATAGDQPQVRPGAARAPRRDPRHPPRRGRARPARGPR